MSSTKRDLRELSSLRDASHGHSPGHGSRDYGGKREKLAPPPKGLIARTFAVGGDDFVLFSWAGNRTEESDVVSTVNAATAPAPASRTAVAGLSSAEQGVLEYVVRGASNREIALSRGVSERTIANQVASILRKVGARSRFELIRRYPAA